MRKYLSIVILLFFFSRAEAQLFGKKDISLQQGFMSFHQKSLNNDSDVSKSVSIVNELDRNFSFSRFACLNYGIGAGVQKNPHSSLGQYQHSNFFRVKFGLVLHIPQNHNPHNWSPNRLNPYLKVGYNLDIMDKTYKELNNGRLSSSLKFGAGMVYRISHYVGLLYEFSHNQRVSPDYRTFFQHNFGIIINLDTPHQEF